MATIGPSAGASFFKIAGAQVQLRGGLTIETGGDIATAVPNQDGSISYTEKPEPGMIDLEASDSGGLSLVQLQAIRNQTITVELANGKVYLLVNGLTEGKVSLNGETGAVKLKFAGLIVEMGVSA